MTVERLLLLSFVVFSIGLFGVLARRHVIAILLSLELMFNSVNLAILAVAWVAGRIYKVGILMSGKRPTLPELMRWIREA